MVYVFIGNGATFPAGIFNSYVEGEMWISNTKVSGILTEMPVGTGIYDWAIENEFFKITKEYQKGSKFIQKFSSASLNHWYFENGCLLD
ncbi:hypothetical protein [Flammeovirga sp. SJP92]|uniref:DUF7710 domain-containing protein n=1 Tax=Flammeovirga sp. SJP92 TaxID=1775430 RepID=UPI000786A71C|nr:hypothetical protein [Flammeovirga sp. SJP92]KXX70001.1 hypothetical protein AVL50_14080 [Flammeovirga sp. SJP92]